MHARTFALLAGLSLAFVSTNAAAHAVLMNPVPLTNDDNAKSGPCGCYFGAGPEDPAEDASALACPANYKTTKLTIGEPLQITWNETVNHTGKFRLALSTKAINLVKRADMDASVIYEADDAINGGLASETITVPNTPCTNCVLQLRQFMAGATKPYYYSCAAVDIVSPSGSSSSSGGGGSAGSSGSSGGGGTGGTGGASGTGASGGNENVIGAGPAPIDQPHISGACSVGESNEGSSSPLGWATFGLIVLALRRRVGTA